MSGILRWGTGDLVMTPRAFRGFVVCHLVNLRDIALHRIQFSLFPAEGMEFSAYPDSFDLAPFEEAVIIFSYTASRSSKLQIMVLFTSGTGEVLFLQDDLMVSEATQQDLVSKSVWENVIPLLFRGESTLKKDIVPSEFVELVEKGFRVHLNLLGGAPSDTLSEYSWAILDPLVILSFAPPNALKIYASSRDLLHRLERLLPAWLQGSNHTLRNAANLGQSLAKMKDYVDLGWKTEETLSLVRRISNLLTDLKLPVSWPVMQIEKMLTGTDTLKKLTDIQIASLNEMISTLERYVLLG